MSDIIDSLRGAYDRYQDRSYSSILMMVVGFGLLAVLPLLGNGDLPIVLLPAWITTSLLILVLIWAFTAQAWNIMSGFTGLFSFGHAAFFGIGAYTTMYLSAEQAINPWFGMLIGSAIAVAYGGVMGYLTLRYDVRGHYFVLVTLAFAELARYVVLNSDFLRGSSGYFRPNPDAYGADFGVTAFQFIEVLPYYYVILAFLAVVTVVAWVIKHSQIGLYLFAIREDYEAAKSLGISPFRYSMFAITTSAFFTAWAGAFWSMYFTTIRPDPVFGLLRNVDILLPAIVGGMGTIAGPIVGAFVVILPGEYARMTFTDIPGLQQVIYGLFFVFIALYSPNGVLYWPKQVIEYLSGPSSDSEDD